MTRVLVLVPALLVCLTGAAHSQEGWTRLGDDIRLKASTPIGELTAHPERHFNRDVRIEGVIASACTNEGCFIEVVSDDGSGEGIVVNFPGLRHTFPTDCAGRRVVVEGMFYQKVYPASRVLHWQGHSFRQGREVPEFSLVRRILAKGVRLGPRQGPVPPPDEILPYAPDRIDLAVMEFEADGFGTGRKVLEPGGVTEAHSSGRYREIVVCLEGRIRVRRGSAEPVTLGPGEMTYIPEQTEHELTNVGDSPAAYVFVFSRAPEPEPEERTHSH
jgi:quercetin dioxygenase-like cupin family protein